MNAQISNSNSAALYYLRSDRLEYGAGASPERPPETRLNFFIPTDFYKAEDSNVFSPNLFGSVFASYQYPRYTQTPIGGLDKNVQYYDNSFHNTYYYELDKDPQKQANLQVSTFFNTGRINHELKLSFNYRQQIADSATGLPGDQNLGSEYEYSSSNTALLSRGVRRIYSTQFWTGTLGDTFTAGNLTVAAEFATTCSRQRTVPARRLGTRSSPTLHELRCRRGVLPGPAGGEVPRSEGLAVAVHELAAAGFRDLRLR